MKKGWDWLAIYAVVIYILQLNLFANFFVNNMKAYLIIFSIIFLAYFLYSFYYIFKINRDKDRTWKVYRTVRNISFLLIFIALCFYSVCYSIDIDIKRITLELIKGNKVIERSYYEMIINKDLYSKLGLSALIIGIPGLINFWKEMKIELPQ